MSQLLSLSVRYLSTFVSTTTFPIVAFILLGLKVLCLIPLILRWTSASSHQILLFRGAEDMIPLTMDTKNHGIMLFRSKFKNK